jgi:hypothetical protein
MRLTWLHESCTSDATLLLETFVRQARCWRTVLADRAGAKIAGSRAEGQQFNEFRVQQQQHVASIVRLLFFYSHDDPLSDSNQRSLISRSKLRPWRRRCSFST